MLFFYRYYFLYDSRFLRTIFRRAIINEMESLIYERKKKLSRDLLLHQNVISVVTCNERNFSQTTWAKYSPLKFFKNYLKS